MEWFYIPAAKKERFLFGTVRGVRGNQTRDLLIQREPRDSLRLYHGQSSVLNPTSAHPKKQRSDMAS